MMGSFDALLLEPAAAKEAALNKGGPKIPLIAYPHGGPHSNMGQVLSLLALLVQQYKYWRYAPLSAAGALRGVCHSCVVLNLLALLVQNYKYTCAILALRGYACARMLTYADVC